MARIEVKKRPQKALSVEDILARFCFYFPQYTFQEARKIPYHRVIQMLKVVDRELSMKYLMLTRISAAPHTKKGAGVKKLIKELKDNIE